MIIVIVLLLGVIGVGGYFLIKGNNDSSKEIGELKNEVANLGKKTEDTKKNESIIENKEKTVENTSNTTATNTNGNLGITYIKQNGKHGTLTLPQISEDSEGARSINEKIKKIYSLDEVKGVADIVICSEGGIGYTSENLMGIYINLTDGADNGISYYFYYDTDSKKELTLKDIIEKEGFSLSEINTKYQETLDSMANNWGGENKIKGRDYTITGEEMFYTRNESSKEVGHYVNNLYIVIPIDKASCLENEKIYSISVPFKYIDGYLQF